MDALIKHSAQIIAIKKDKIEAQIERQTACASCFAHQSCEISKSQSKIIEIETPQASKYHIGDKIEVGLQEKKGVYALFFGYLVPLLLVLITLFLCLNAQISEITSGIYSIIVLIPYYFGLSLAHKFFQRKFYFSIIEK